MRKNLKFYNLKMDYKIAFQNPIFWMRKNHKTLLTKFYRSKPSQKFKTSKRRRFKFKKILNKNNFNNNRKDLF